MPTSPAGVAYRLGKARAYVDRAERAVARGAWAEATALAGLAAALAVAADPAEEGMDDFVCGYVSAGSAHTRTVAG